MTEPRKRRPKGTGSVYRRGDVWEAAYTIPKAQRQPGVSDRPITKQGPTADKALANLMAHLRTFGVTMAVVPSASATTPALEDRYGSEPTHRRTPNENEPGHSYTLEAWANEWLRDYTGNLDEETRNRYEGHVRNHIVPHVGQRRLNELSTRVLIDEWWTVIQAKRKVRKGVETDKPLLGTAGLTQVYKTMRRLLKAAHDKVGSRMGLVASLIHPPHATTRPESDDEIEAAANRIRAVFFRELSHEDVRWAVFLFGLLGLRQGERLALSTDSIDLTPGRERLLISKQLAWSSNERKFILKKATKNGDTRKVPLFDEYLEAAKRLLDRHERLKTLSDFRPDPEFAQLLMINDDGSIRDRRQDLKAWKELVGSEYRGHVTRHVTGQLLAERGIGTDVAKVLLGWRSDAYAHYYRTITTAYAGRVLREQYSLDEVTAAPPARIAARHS